MRRILSCGALSPRLLQEAMKIWGGLGNSGSDELQAGRFTMGIKWVSQGVQGIEQDDAFEPGTGNPKEGI